MCAGEDSHATTAYSTACDCTARRPRPGHGAPSTAPADARVLVLEGVGAGRASLATRADAVVWVQSDRNEARERGLRRDVELGRTPEEAERFWDEWMSAEEPFLAGDRPWERADLVVGSHEAEWAPRRTTVAEREEDPATDGPLTRTWASGAD